MNNVNHTLLQSEISGKLVSVRDLAGKVAQNRFDNGGIPGGEITLRGDNTSSEIKVNIQESNVYNQKFKSQYDKLKKQADAAWASGDTDAGHRAVDEMAQLDREFAQQLILENNLDAQLNDARNPQKDLQEAMGVLSSAASSLGAKAYVVVDDNDKEVYAILTKANYTPTEVSTLKEVDEKVDANQATLDQVNGKVDKVQQTLDGLDLDGLWNDIWSLKTQLTTFGGTLNGVNQNLEEIKETVKNLIKNGQNNEELTNKISALEKKFEESQKTLSTKIMKAVTTNNQTVLEAQNKKFDDQGKRIGDIDNKIDSLIEKIDALDSSTAEGKEALKQAQTELTNKLAELDTAKQELETIKKDLEQTKTSMNQQVEDLKTIVEKFPQIIQDSVTKGLQTISQSNAQFQSELDQKIKTMKKGQDDFLSKLPDDIKNAVKDALGEDSPLGQKLDKQKEGINTANEGIGRIEEMMKKDLQEKNKEINSLRKANAQLVSTENALLMALATKSFSEEAKNEIQRSLEALKNLEQWNDSRIQELELEKDELQKKLEKTTKARKSNIGLAQHYRTKATQAQSQIQSLTDELQQTQEALAKKPAESDDGKKQLEQAMQLVGNDTQWMDDVIANDYKNVDLSSGDVMVVRGLLLDSRGEKEDEMQQAKALVFADKLLQAEKGKQAETVKDLQTKLAQAQKGQEQLQQQMHQQAETAKNEKAELEQKVTDLETAKNKAEGFMKTLQGQMNTMIKTANQTIDVKNQEIAQQKTTIENKDKTIEEKQTRINELETQAKQSESETQQALTAANAKLAKIDPNFDATQEAKNELYTSKNNVYNIGNGDLHEMKKVILTQCRNNSKEEKKANLESPDQQVKALAIAGTILQLKNAEMQQKIEKLKGEVESEKEAKEAAEKELEEKKAELQEAQNNNQTLLNELDGKDDVEWLRTKAGRLEKEVNGKDSKITKLQEELTAAKANDKTEKVNELNKQIIALRKEKDIATQNLQEANNNLAQLQRQIDGDRANAGLKKQLEEAQQQVEAAEEAKQEAETAHQTALESEQKKTQEATAEAEKAKKGLEDQKKVVKNLTEKKKWLELTSEQEKMLNADLDMLANDNIKGIFDAVLEYLNKWDVKNTDAEKENTDTEPKENPWADLLNDM